MRAYDPAAKGNLAGIDRAADPYSVCEGADVLVVLTEWDEFRWLDFDKVAGLMTASRVVDARNLLDRHALERAASPTPASATEARGLGVRVVVTGGAGFLGSHLCEALLDRGDEVVAIDNLVTGNVGQHRAPVRAARLHASSTTTSATTSGCRATVDAVLHFASPASPVDYLEIPIQTLKVGSLGTHNCLGLAKAKGARFLLASTSEVYGDPQVHPQTEDYWGHVNPVGPRGVYDEAKRFAEAMTMAYHRYHGLDVRIVRIFNTYGPRMRANDGRVVSNFLVQALQGKPLTLYGDGAQTRSFCYVDDEVRGILALLDGDITGPVNIGNPGEFTMRELAELVLEVTGSASEVIFEPLPVDDPTQRQPDITLAREALGWEPTVALREGLERTAAYFRTALGL